MMPARQGPDSAGQTPQIRLLMALLPILTLPLAAQTWNAVANPRGEDDATEQGDEFRFCLRLQRDANGRYAVANLANLRLVDLRAMAQCIIRAEQGADPQAQLLREILAAQYDETMYEFLVFAFFALENLDDLRAEFASLKALEEQPQTDRKVYDAVIARMNPQLEYKIILRLLNFLPWPNEPKTAININHPQCMLLYNALAGSDFDAFEKALRETLDIIIELLSGNDYFKRYIDRINERLNSSNEAEGNGHSGCCNIL